MRLALAAAVAAAVLVSQTASAESLAEIAARTQREKEAKAKSKTGKVFTEADLQGRPTASGSVSRPGEGNLVLGSTAAPSPGASPAADGTVAGGEAEKPKTPEEERAERQKAWRERLDKAQAEVTRLMDEAQRLENALADSSAGYYGPNRAAAASRLQETRRQLVTAQQAVADIQEEGRRAGMR